MVHRKFIYTIITLLTAALMVSGGIVFALHHSLMNAQPMVGAISTTADGCGNLFKCAKICNVGQLVVAPLSENVLTQLAYVPLIMPVAGLAVIFLLLLLDYLEPILKRPPKLYIAYSVIRI